MILIYIYIYSLYTLGKTSPESPIYHSYFKHYKEILGKTWKLINKTIKSKKIDEVPNEFKISNKLIDDPKTIANG